MNRMKIIIEKPISKRRIFITGFHGIGWVGYISIKHLLSTLNFERIGFVCMPYEPAYSAYSTSQTYISTPGELYYNYDYGLTVFAIHWYIYSRHIYLLVQELAKWVVLNNYELAVLFGGLDSEVRGNDTNPLRIITTSMYNKLNLPKGNVKLLDINFAVVGPLAIMLNEFERLKFPAIAILPYADKFRIDPSAAVKGLEYFSQIFNISLDTSKLRELAEILEKEIEEFKKTLEKKEISPYYI